MGVDAGALGNHDFDCGLPFLAEAIRREARFPILAANLKTCQDLSGVCLPAAILDLKGIRIGLIGLVTRAETYLDPRHCQIADPIATAQNLAPAIRPYCEVLIVLSHLGYGLKNSSVPMADAGDVELAGSLPPGCVDLIIGGHSHSVLNLDGLCPENMVNGIPIVQAGANGEYLGRVEVTIRGKHAAITDARLIPTVDLPIEQSFQESEVLPLIIKLRDLKKRYLGEVDPNPELSTETIKKDFASGELALANFVTDALVMRLAQRGLNVELAMIDSSALLCGLPVGEALTFGDWFQVMPYTDTISLFILTLTQLKKLLNDNAQRLDRPGEAPLERGFLHFSRQLRYRIDPGKKRGEAIARDITMDGRPLHEHRCEFFTLAATRFIRQTATAWEASLDRSQAKWLLNLAAHPYKETNISLRKELIEHIVAYGGVNRAGGAQRDGRLQVLSPADPQKQG
jgi:5'-nucleotidase/5'-nucleotidase/UDP-sugar diphosphatase